MIPSPSSDFSAQEALDLGATPVVRVSISPFFHPNGVNADGTFVETSFVSPGEILAAYAGFVSGSWVSPAIKSPVGLFPTPATLTFDWSPGGNLFLLQWRTAATLAALSAASWVTLAEDDLTVVAGMGGPTEISIQQYYQFRLVLAGYRCWASDGTTDEGFIAYATDSPGDPDQGYAADANPAHPTDDTTWIANIIITGVFAVSPDDVEKAGCLTSEAPKNFNLVAGNHSGLLLNNRQVDAEGNPAPLYSPNKASFIFAGDLAWYDKQLQIDFGYRLPDGSVTTFPAFLGKITKWGPITRAAGKDGTYAPHTAEIYARDWVSDLFTKKCALPDAAGNPQPLTFGEWLATPTKVSGTSPAPVARSAYFNDGNFSELDGVGQTGGGAYSIVTPGLIGAHAFQAQVTGANQSAYGMLELVCSPPGTEMFVKGNLQFQTIPADDIYANLNMIFLQLLDYNQNPIAQISVDNTGAIYLLNLATQGKFLIGSYTGIPLPFALWWDGLHFKMWLNGDEVITYNGSAQAVPITQYFWFGAQTAGTAENWTIIFDDIEITQKYYDNAFVVSGFPFAGIGAVYVDNAGQPDTYTDPVTGYITQITRYPQWGMVQFTSTALLHIPYPPPYEDDTWSEYVPDPNYTGPSGSVLVRVIMNPGGMHPADVISALVTLAGGIPDPDSFAAAKAAMPGDVIHARFESQQGEIVSGAAGARDFTQQSLTFADAINDVCAAVLYFFVVDHGTIKLFPFTGISADESEAVMDIDDSLFWECTQTIDEDSQEYYVDICWGWYDRNPDLFYIAGNYGLGQGEDMDLTWQSSNYVCTESRAMAISKANLYYQFLQAQDRLEPVKMSLKAARLELQDPVAINDPVIMDGAINYWLTRKELNLDRPRESTLQLMRYLGT